MEKLLGYQWPGNVRELENSIQRALVLSQSGYVEAEHVGGGLTKNVTDIQLDACHIEIADNDLSIKQAQRQLEARLISRALARCGGNKSRAAVLLAISYPSLLSKIKQYGLE
jgi:two-component system response regulator AtoC